MLVATGGIDKGQPSDRFGGAGFPLQRNPRLPDCADHTLGSGHDPMMSVSILFSVGRGLFRPRSPAFAFG